MSDPFAVDTSVAVPLLIARHESHAAVSASWVGRTGSLSGQALAETYSVLTRLPGDLRLTPRDAVRLLAARFGRPLLLPARTARRVPGLLADLEIGGGAVYDALVALAARDAGRVLATRDARARPTYRTIGVEIEILS